MEEFRSFLDSADTTGIPSSGAYLNLSRARAFALSHPTISAFLLSSPSPSEDIRILTCPRKLAAAHTLTSAYATTGSGVYDAFFTGAAVLVPVHVLPDGTTLGVLVDIDGRRPIGVGGRTAMRVARVHEDQQVEALWGRFAFRPATGEVLTYTRVMRGRPDDAYRALSNFSVAAGGTPGAACGNLARVGWCGGLTGGALVSAGTQARFRGIVDHDAFVAGAFEGACLLMAYAEGSAGREACCECAERAQGGAVSQCRCVSDAGRGLAGLKGLTGLWNTKLITLTWLPGREGAGLVSKMSMVLTLDCGRDARVVRRLADDALHAAMGGVRLVDCAVAELECGNANEPGGGVLVESWDGHDDGAETRSNLLGIGSVDRKSGDGEGDEEGGDRNSGDEEHGDGECSDGVCVDGNDNYRKSLAGACNVPDVLPDATCSVPAHVDIVNAEARRKERNRASARRASAARTRRVQELAESVRRVRGRALYLHGVRLRLRRENIELRRRLCES